VNQHKIAWLCLGGERQIHCFADAAEIDAGGPKRRVITVDIQHSSRHGQAHDCPPRVQAILQFPGLLKKLHVAALLGGLAVLDPGYAEELVIGCLRLVAQ
jgi:hypothetical protein